MGILSWIVLGLVAGWLASFIVGRGFGVLGDIVVGILGALLGGWLGSTFLGLDVTGFNLTSILLAVLGSVILILILRAISGTRRRAL